MKMKLHHYIIRHAKQGAHAARRRVARHTRRHHLPIGNRTEALQYLEDLFGVNDGKLSPNQAIY